MQKKVIRNRQITLPICLFVAILILLILYYFGRFQMYICIGILGLFLFSFFKADNHVIAQEVDGEVYVYLDKQQQKALLIDHQLISWRVNTNSTTNNFELVFPNKTYSLQVLNMNGIYRFMDQRFHQKNYDYIQQEKLLSTFRGNKVEKMSWKEYRAAKKKQKEMMENNKNEN